MSDPQVLVVLGDSAAVQTGLDPQRSPGAIVLATDHATTAEIAASQVPSLRGLNPARVVVRLGGQDLLDGFDESYVHARVVEICDLIRQLAPRAEVELVAIPPLETPRSFPGAIELEALRRQCNAAGEVTARMRGFRWLDPPAAGGGRWESNAR